MEELKLSHDELRAAALLSLRNKNLPAQYVEEIKESDFVLCGAVLYGEEDEPSLCFICLEKIPCDDNIWRKHIRSHLKNIKIFL